MDIISFNEGSTANGRIENFIENPDSTSGVVTVPSVIASGETITIPAGRTAVLPNVQIDGTLNVDGTVFIPSGSTLSTVVEKVASTDNAIVRFDGTTGDVQNSDVFIDDNGNVGIGITPDSATYSGRSLQMQSYFLTSDVNSHYQMNNVYDTGVLRYKANKYALQYVQDSAQGSHIWKSAPSGIAGNAITWTNAMTLDASGNLTVGTAGAVIQCPSAIYSWVNASSYTSINNATVSGVTQVFNATVGGVLKAAILANGTFQSALGAGGYTGTSDIKLKENIVDSSNKLDKLMQVRVVDYNFKSDESKLKQIGVIAQELETIFPGMVYETKDTKQVEVEKERIIPAVEEVIDEEGNIIQEAVAESVETYTETETVETGETTKAVKYGVFTMLMLKGMQEMRAEYSSEIALLKQEIEILKELNNGNK